MRKVNLCVKNCLKCNNAIPSSIVINGVRRRLFPRNYCLICSPWGSRNNRKLETLRTDGMKNCLTCKLDKSISLYSGTNGSCNFCVAQKARLERREQKAKCVAYLGGACIKCGYNTCQGALDFHHRNPLEKDFEVGRNTWSSLEVLKPELDKCDLLCRNCHAETHWAIDTKEDPAIAFSP